MRIICNNCGAIMEEAGLNLMVCPECDNEAYLDHEDPDAPGKVMQMIGSYTYSEVYGREYDDKPEGCKACDCDNWPKCKDGCNMFED